MDITQPNTEPPNTQEQNAPPPVPSQMPMKQPSSTLKSIIIFFAGVLVGSGSMWVYHNLPTSSQKQAVEIAVTPTLTPKLALPTNWQTYKSQLFPLEFNYPQQMTIEPTLAGNAEVLTLFKSNEASPAAKKEIATIQVLRYEDDSSTEDLRNIDNLQGLYPYAYKDETMKLSNVDARIFSGYLHKNADNSFGDFGMYAFLWDAKRQVSFVLQIKDKQLLNEKNAHLLMNSIRFLEAPPSTVPVISNEPTIFPVVSVNEDETIPTSEDENQN